MPAGRDVGDLVDRGEPGQCESDQGREQAAEQAGQRDTGSTQERAGTEQVADADEPDDREGDPATDTEPAASTELVVDGHPGVDGQAGRGDPKHRPQAGGGPAPGRHDQCGAATADGETHPPPASVELGEFAEHRLAPLGPLWGQQADRPAQQPQRRVLGRAIEEPAGVAPVQRDRHRDRRQQENEEERHHASLRR